MTLCRLHFLDDCTNLACVKEKEANSLTGSAVPNYDGSPETLLAATSWCTMTEESQIWEGTDTE